MKLLLINDRGCPSMLCSFIIALVLFHTTFLLTLLVVGRDVWGILEVRWRYSLNFARHDRVMRLLDVKRFYFSSMLLWRPTLMRRLIEVWHFGIDPFLLFSNHHRASCFILTCWTALLIIDMTRNEILSHIHSYWVSWSSIREPRGVLNIAILVFNRKQEKFILTAFLELALSWRSLACKGFDIGLLLVGACCRVRVCGHLVVVFRTGAVAPGIALRGGSSVRDLLGSERVLVNLQTVITNIVVYFNFIDTLTSCKPTVIIIFVGAA